MSDDCFRYRADVIEELWRHGVYASARTPPGLVRDFVRELYRFEIRQLRERLLRGEFPRHEYADRVVALRNKYPVLSMSALEWLEPR